MSDPKVGKSEGALQKKWDALVGDYALAGGWTPGGQALVVNDAAGGVYTFDGQSGTTLWKEPGAHQGGGLAVEMHPTEPLFATAGQDGRVVVWNAAEGSALHTIEVGKGWVEHLAWSPDGQWLAAVCSRVVAVYDAEGKERWRSEAHPSTVSALAWSSLGELATACYGRVTFYEGATGELRQMLAWKGSLVSIVLSPDAEIVVCGSQDNSVHFWRRSTGADSMMSGYPAKPSSLSFDSTGKLLATGGGPTILVWSFEGLGPEGTSPGILDLHPELVTTLSFAPQGRLLASGDRAGTVLVWSAKPDGAGAPVGASFLSGGVSQVYWQPDGSELAALDAAGQVTVWRVDTAETT